jgi:alcohol/geraniol dehydrogenase (NADP+)
MNIKAYTVKSPGEKLKLSEYDPRTLGSGDVEIDVDYCGLCHSDLSMLGNDWGMTGYPFVPGHEVSGRISAVGENVTTLKIGQKVGLGWFSSSCGECFSCISGDQHLCATATGTIVHRPGGFAEKVRASAKWVFPLPDALDPAAVGPLFCGGITVFSPLVISGVKPTDRVAVIGIGGLGHMAL